MARIARIGAGIALAVGALLVLQACSSLEYYLHTASGHLDVMSRRQPISTLLDDDSTPPELRAGAGSRRRPNVRAARQNVH